MGIGVMNGKRGADRDEEMKGGECYRRIQKVAVLSCFGSWKDPEGVRVEQMKWDFQI